MNIKNKSLFLILLFFINKNVFAACAQSVTISALSINWTPSYTSQSVTFTVSKTSGGACNFVVGMTKGGASTYSRQLALAANRLDYQLYREIGLSTPIYDQPDSSGANNLISGSLGAGNKSTIKTFYFSIPSSNVTTPVYKPSGSYTDTVIVRTYQKNGNNISTTPDTSTNFGITVTVPKILDISIIPTGSNFDQAQTSQNVNLGDLSNQTSQGLDMRVRTNAGYNITFSSQNDGVLKNSVLSVNTTVPYSLSVNGSVKNLVGSAGSPVNVATGSGQTSTSGVANTLLFSPGDSSNAISGTYQDFITVTAATIE